MDIKNSIKYYLFNASINKQLQVFDSLLKKFNQPVINESPYFLLGELYNRDYLLLHFKKEGCIEFSIVLSESVFELHVDRIPELLFVSSKDLINSHYDIVDLLEKLFTSKIKVKYCGKNYTELLFYNETDQLVKKLKTVQGLYLKVNCTENTFNPIVE